MTITLHLIPKAEKSVLRQLMELYLYDFSEFYDLGINEHGYFGYPYLDHYWTEEGRDPYWIQVDGKIAGFVLVSNFCFLIKDTHRKSISEFFIMRKYRRKGIGKYVAHQIFDTYQAKWEVALYLPNKPSLLFWEKAIKEYLGSDHEKLKTKDFAKGLKQAFIFENK